MSLDSSFAAFGSSKIANGIVCCRQVPGDCCAETWHAIRIGTRSTNRPDSRSLTLMVMAFSNSTSKPILSPLRCSVHLLIDLGVAHDGLHVVTCFGKGDRLDELFHVAIVARRTPIFHAVRAGIVSRQRI